MVFLNTKIFPSLFVVNTTHLLCYMAGVCKSATLSALVQISTQQTVISLHCFLQLRPERFRLCVSSFSHRGITSPRRALPACPAFSSICSLGFLFLLWCLSLSSLWVILLQHTLVFPISECSCPYILVAPAWISSLPNLMKDCRFSSVILSDYPKL
jgi:hypothetical protein